jgi:CheY-like chemotaxis protein
MDSDDGDRAGGTLVSIPTQPPSKGHDPDLTTIVLADDHTVVRSALRMLLEAEEGFEVVAEAGNADDAARYVLGHKPTAISTTTSAAGRVLLSVRPDGRLRRVLDMRGRATVKLTVVFAPVGGESLASTLRLRLHRRG